MLFTKEFLKIYLSKFRELDKHNKMILLSVVASLIIMVSAMIGGAGFSYDVVYNGETVARISDMSVYYEAEEIAKTHIACDTNADVKFAEPEFRVAFGLASRSTTAEELSDSIIKNSSELKQGYAVSVGGQDIAYVLDTAFVDECIKKHCESFNVDRINAESKLAEELSYISMFIDDSALSDENQIAEAVNGLRVITTATEITTYTIGFETIVIEDSKKPTGYTYYSTKGVEGVVQTESLAVYENGVRFDAKIISETVVSQPVNEVMVKGTAKKTTNVYQNESTKGFIWPLEVKGYISSYWGDGRNHKGLDIAAVAGVEIYAVQSGRVTFAGWNDDYGWNVIIDHGNGVQTRYAHSRKLHVKTGDYVEQGHFIAEVGTTGWSTGNHLHFEVIINGTRVNPAPYLGI